MTVSVNDQSVTFEDQLNLLPFLTFVSYDQLPETWPQRIATSDAISDPAVLTAREAPYVFTAFSLSNRGEETIELVLFLGYEQRVELRGGSGPFLGGTMVPRSQVQGELTGDVFLRDEGFSTQMTIALAPGESQNLQLLAERIIDKPLALDLRLLEPEWFAPFSAPGLRHFWEGLFQGMIWILILYHLLLWVNIRQTTYLYYCLYMVSISGLTLGDFGYWQRDLFGEAPFLGFLLFQLLQYLTGIMTLVFMYSFVRLQHLNPKWYRITKTFITANFVVLGCIAFYYFTTWDAQIISLSKALVIPFAIFGVWLCYVLIQSRDRIALYFAVAGIILAVAVGLNAGYELLNPAGERFGTDFTRFYFIQGAVIVHLLTFAFGMGYRRRLEEAAYQRTRELEELKSRLYTNITHEFRTPLSVILGLNEQIEGFEQERGLIRRNGDHLLRLINQFLDLSKLESGNLRVNAIQGNIVAYMEYLTESFHSMATDKGIRLVFYPEEREVLMDYDEAKIQHIIYNLLSNALKFTESGGKVVLHLKQVNENGKECLQLKVQDTGVGIPDQQLPFVFDRFYQVDNSATRAAEGTGVGLALTRELVELLEGNISVDSQVEVGTTFLVHLPIRRTADLITSNAPASPAFPAVAGGAVTYAYNEEAGTEGEDQQPVLLLVEDNQDVVIYIRKLLNDQYRVHEAANGRDGIKRAQELIPDVIISDVMMPFVDGYALCDTLKKDERTSHVPIILLTAKATDEERIRGLKAGADAFLVKPFNQQELFVRLASLVSLREELRKRYATGTFAPAEEENQPEAKPAVKDELLLKLEAAVKERLGDNTFGVPDLAKAVGHSQMQVYRKLKGVVDKTPSQFIRAIRLKKGRELLVNSSLNVSEIAYDIGFSDPNYFSRMFSEAYGVSPSEFRNKS